MGDFTDPYNPVFSEPVTPTYKAGGSLWRSSIRTYSLLVPGMEASYGYRDIEEGYKRIIGKILFITMIRIRINGGITLS